MRDVVETIQKLGENWPKAETVTIQLTRAEVNGITYLLGIANGYLDKESAPGRRARMELVNAWLVAIGGTPYELPTEDAP